MLNLRLKTIPRFIFLFGRSWLTVCANQITTVLSCWLDSFPLCSVRHCMLSVSFQTVLCRGYYAVRSGLNTRIRNQTEQGQEDIGAAVIGCSHSQFFKHTSKDCGFSSTKITIGFRKCRCLCNRSERAKSSSASLIGIQNPGLCSTGSSSRIWIPVSKERKLLLLVPLHQ